MRPVAGLNQGQNNQPPDINQQIKGCWEQLPLFCRFIFISTTSLYLISFLIPYVSILVCIPYSVIYQLYLWQLFTAPFVHQNLFHYLLSVLSYIPTAMQQEKLDGTVKSTFRFFALSLIIQLIFVLLAFLLSFYDPTYLVSPSIGLWPILFCDIVIECNRSPDLARGLCCLPVQIKAKYYPWVLLLLFTLLSGPQLSLIAGFGVGYLQIFGYLKFVELTAVKAKLWQGKMPFLKYQNHPAFVSVDGAAQNSGLPTFVRAQAPAGQQTQASQPATQPTVPFQGRGVKLGGVPSQGPSSVKSYGSTKTTASSQPSILVDAAGRNKSKEENVKHNDESDTSVNSNSRDNDDSIGHDMRQPQQQIVGQDGYARVGNTTPREDEEDEIKDLDINITKK